MKPLLPIIFFLVFSSIIHAQKVETILYDLNHDGRKDSIILGAKTENVGPGIFESISIKLSGNIQAIYKAKDVWDKVDSSFLRVNRNAVKSNNIFVCSTPDYSLILLFGFTYGSGRDEFSIIKITNNQVKMTFDGKLEIPISLLKINKTVELLGRKYDEKLDDSLKREVTVYNPFLIYSLANNSAQIDSTATIDYNQKKYIWAGWPSTQIMRVLHQNNKYTLIKYFR